jgi:peptidoglycan/LPS O-acetylase OafA/YrhL
MTVKQPHLSRPNYRPDIDGLRAIAVLSVVAFHAFPSWVSGGFIGVDIFFVISGYLISTIIFENLDRGTFNFTEFYARRIKRIFPALLLVMIACFAFGWFTLLADEYKQLGKHIAAGASFISNFILWNEAGYFDNSAESKPLLHLWSLGIEEQFYIFWPLFIWLAWRQKFSLLKITALITIISFVLNIKGVEGDAVATFYSPQTRFWELLCGSLLSWLALYNKNIRRGPFEKIDGLLASFFYKDKRDASGRALSSSLSVLGLMLLIYGFTQINKDLSFPGEWALIPVIGSALLIMSGPQAFINHTILSNKIFVWFGLISFPLYLWHWPLLSYARIIEGDTPSRNTRIAIVFISIGLAWLTYKLIERPIRLGHYAKIKVFILATLMITIGYLGYNTYERGGLNFRNIEKRHGFTQHLDWPYWTTDKSCADKFNISPCQISSNKPQVMILGDSHGNHLYPGLVSALPKAIGVFSGGTCPPIQGIKYYVTKNQASHPCATVDYLSQNLRILDENPTIQQVVIGAFWRPALNLQFINPKEKEFWGNIRLESTNPNEGGLASDELIYRGLKRTINELLSRKKEFLFVRDTPDFENDIRDECFKRLSLNNSLSCSLPRSVFELRREKENLLVNKLLVDFPSLKVFDPFDILCDPIQCFIVIDGKPVYRDSHHLSVYGSTLIGKGILKYFFSVW